MPVFTLFPLQICVAPYSALDKFILKLLLLRRQMRLPLYSCNTLHRERLRGVPQTQLRRIATDTYLCRALYIGYGGPYYELFAAASYACKGFALRSSSVEDLCKGSSKKRGRIVIALPLVVCNNRGNTPLYEQTAPRSCLKEELSIASLKAIFVIQPKLSLNRNLHLQRPLGPSLKRNSIKRFPLSQLRQRACYKEHISLLRIILYPERYSHSLRLFLLFPEIFMLTREMRPQRIIITACAS